MLNAQAADYKKPEFTLELTITGVGVDIRLNDISIEFEKRSGHSTMTYEVNSSIIAGVNELKVITFPFMNKVWSDGQTKAYHEEAEVKAALYVNELGDSDNKTLLSQIHLRPGLALDKMASESRVIDGLDGVVLDNKSKPLSFPVITFEQQITATRKTLPVQDNFPRWAWQDGQIIEDTQENYTSLLAAYREIYDAYKNREREKLLALHAPRSAEYAIAFYLDGGVEAGHKFLSTGEMLDATESELSEFRTVENKEIKFDIYANGRMARIISVAEYHPFIFKHKTMNIIHTMKFGFYKNKAGKWIMIR